MHTVLNRSEWSQVGPRWEFRAPTVIADFAHCHYCLSALRGPSVDWGPERCSALSVEAPLLICLSNYVAMLYDDVSMLTG